MTAGTRSFVALLRAVNVGGTSVIKMTDVARVTKSLGYQSVQTYLQSGNVLFTTAETDPKRLADKLQQALVEQLHLRTLVFIRTAEQLRAAAAANPFDPLHHPELHCHLLFLDSEPTADRITRLLKLAAPEYRFAVHNNVCYYVYDRAHDSRNRRTIDFEHALGVAATARTWRVVERLVGLAERISPADNQRAHDGD